MGHTEGLSNWVSGERPGGWASPLHAKGGLGPVTSRRGHSPTSPWGPDLRAATRSLAAFSPDPPAPEASLGGAD